MVKATGDGVRKKRTQKSSKVGSAGKRPRVDSRKKSKAKRKKRPPRDVLLRSGPNTKVRTQIVERLGDHWPATARLILEHLIKTTDLAGRPRLAFAVNRFPLSVNHQTQFRSRQLRPEVHDFRDLIRRGVKASGKTWIPTGITAAVLLFESPAWLTKANTVREMDSDNRVKPSFDAVQGATKIGDELHWEFHVYKIQSHRERTVVYLFDLGDLVEYYRG